MKETKQQIINHIQKYNQQIEHGYQKENLINLYLISLIAILVTSLMIFTMFIPHQIPIYIYTTTSIIDIMLALISIILSHHWFTHRYYKKHIPNHILKYVFIQWTNNKQRDKMIKDRIKINERYLKYSNNHMNPDIANDVRKELNELEVKHLKYKQQRIKLKPIKNVIIQGPKWININ